jgi:uncharacterized protein (DUF302 family)
MAKNITFFSVGLMAGIIIAFFSIFIVLPRQMFVIAESGLSFDETVNALTKSAEANEWSIPQQYNLQAILKKHGFETGPVVVISMCNPILAEKILNSDDSKFLSAFMPCRLSIYEDDGKIYASMLNTRLFYPFLKKDVKETMRTANKESMQILRTLKY